MTEIKRYVKEVRRTDVQLMPIRENPKIYSSTKYLVVYMDPKETPSKYNSIVLFLAMNPRHKAPYRKDVDNLLEKVRADINRKITHGEFLINFCSRPNQAIHPLPQGTHPVLYVHQPECNKTVTPRACSSESDRFNREYVNPAQPQGKVNPWSVYSGVPSDLQCNIDIEKAIQDPCKLLGRGGFGVTVVTSTVHVAKVNMFPEMADWSVPVIDDPFYRYTHAASQAEEIMVGVSMKHPNVLRTFGGYWCDIPGCQLGGRAVMEKALFSLQEFIAKMNVDKTKNAAGATNISREQPPQPKRNTALIPIIDLDTLRGLDYLQSRNIQHRDLTYRNILVCHDPSRTPVPFAFKISNFGMACNYSTPNQQRGNRVHMAPEVLWCLNSTMASDVFSWYCVMWELYAGVPLIEYRTSSLEYCKKIYADHLSKLVGVYTPSNPETAFLSSHMKAFDGEMLYNQYRDRRPTADDISSTLSHMGKAIRDQTFVNVGVLCITLFPQERWTPAQLLKLNRYTYLAHDVSDATVPCHIIPSTV